MIGQYYQLIRLGKHGYRAIMSNLTRTADYLTEQLEAQGFVIMSKRSGEGLPLVAFRFPGAGEKGGSAERHYDEFALAHHLRARSWVVPAYTMAPHTEKLKMLRVVVREDFSRSMCDMLISDIKLCCGLLQNTDKETVSKQEEYLKQHVTSTGKAKHKGSHEHYQVCWKPVYPSLIALTAKRRTRSIRSRGRPARHTRSVSRKLRSCLEILVRDLSELMKALSTHSRVHSRQSLLIACRYPIVLCLVLACSISPEEAPSR